MRTEKPLGIKAYGSIPHLPNSRLGPADKGCSPGQARIATERTRDKHDLIIVQEKLDGSNVAAAKINGEIVPLTRAGYRADTSPYRQHHLWNDWVYQHYARFQAVLNEGERLVGEWLAQAHGTRYDLNGREPFVAFDIMTGNERLPFTEFCHRVDPYFSAADVISYFAPCSVERAMHMLNYRNDDGTYGAHGALDPIEGAIWRVERHGKVDFLVKYVRPDKVDGCFLEQHNNGEPLWNWLP